MKLAFLFAWVFFSPGSLLCGLCQKALPIIERLNQKSPSAGAETRTAHEAVAEILRSVRAPAGIAIYQNCGDSSRHLFTLEAGLSGSEALDKIVQQSGDLVWSVRNEVVRVRPVKGTPSLLQTRLQKVNLREQRPIEAVLDLLLQRKEIARAAQAGGVGRGFDRLGMYAVKRDGSAPEYPRYEIVAESISLADALDSIVRTHGSAIWLYAQRECRGQKTFQVEIVAK